MAISALASPVPARPRLRFTLAGLFICLLGLAVGLAYWRLPSATTMIDHKLRLPNVLLASCSVWFVIGMFPQAALAGNSSANRPICRERPLGSNHQMAAGLSIIAVLSGSSR
jgi:hypothetical protein